MTSRGLRWIATLVEVPDCDCPLDLACPCRESCPPELAKDCVHCRGECDCAPLSPLAPVDSPLFGFQPPCHHVLQRGQIDISFDQLAALLSGCAPAAYAERPRDPEPSHCLTQAARVEVLASRQERGLALWNPNDWLPEDDELDFLGRTVDLTAGNNRPRDGGVMRIGGKHVA